MKTFLLIVSIVGSATCIIFIWLTLFSSERDTGTSVQLPDSQIEPYIDNTTVMPIPDRLGGSKIALPTNDGQFLQINNIVKDAQSVGSGMYTVSPDDSYSLIYNSQNNSIAVQINVAPVLEYRTQVTFMAAELLGVSVMDLCRINAYVGTTIDIDEVYGGQNLGFSGC